jgi:LysM repeat protein
MAATLLVGPWKHNVATRDPLRGLPPARRAVKTPPLRLLGSRGSRLTVPYAPLPVTHDGLATSWVQVPRPLRDPLPLLGSNPLHTMGFDLLIARRSVRESIEDWLAALRLIGRSGEAFTVSYGPMEAGLWHIESLGIDVEERVAGTNQARRATAHLALSAADKISQLGPMSGGSGGARPVTGAAPSTAGKAKGSGSAAPPRGPAPAPKQPAKARTYTVKAGDNLSRISQLMYGSTAHWRAIADANKLPNADLIRVGQVLKIPAL